MRNVKLREKVPLPLPDVGSNEGKGRSVGTVLVRRRNGLRVPSFLPFASFIIVTHSLLTYLYTRLGSNRERDGFW